jgi:hypothetical protein
MRTYLLFLLLGAFPLIAGERFYAVVETGYYWSNQGKEQHIDIDTLIGDQFTVSNHTDSSVFAGLGYFFKAVKTDPAELSLGINAFYLPNTSVKGYVIQENLFKNLSYTYHVRHYPIYAALESKLGEPFAGCALNLRLGIGPNILHVGQVEESPLNRYTVPDNIFSSHTKVTFSFTTGIGLQFDQPTVPFSLRMAYRFFYLGEGNFHPTSSQVLNNLKTGTCTANAAEFSIQF